MAAEAIMELEMFPMFYAANFIDKSNVIRDDSTPSEFSREHPFASWVSTMAACFSQKMLGNALLAIPIIDPWQDSRLVVMATIIWYFINFSIFDMVHKVSRFRVTQVIVGIMVEIFRVNQIYDGVNVAMEKYDNAPFIALSIGTLSGNGIRFMLLIHRLCRGIWIPEDVEFMTPSCDTRSSLVASFIFWYVHGDMFPEVYMRVLIFLLIMKALRLWKINPYRFIENFIYHLTIGIWDTLSSFRTRKVDVEIPEEIELPKLAVRVRRRRSRARSRSCRR